MDPRTATQPKYTAKGYAVSMLSPECHNAHIQQPPNSLRGLAIQDVASEQNRLQESLKRSVTLVFWYKPGCEPIRLHQEIPTFPLFQLSQFAQLVNDLGFSTTSYVDMYNPHSSTWEQQTVATVRVVESEQRLLYRVRKSLLEGLSHDECPGVVHEISMQPQTVEQMKPSSFRTTMKRPAADAGISDTSHANKYSRVDAGSSKDGISQTHVDGGARGYSQVLPVSMQTPNIDMQQNFSVSHQSQNRASESQAAPHANNSPSLGPDSGANTSANGRSPIPYHPHPPLKRWPNDYTVSEIAAGFRQMDTLISQQPAMTQKLSFERVFGCRYIKSTVCRHRAVWKRADPVLKETYESMGPDERAVWGDFVKKVEGKPGKDAQRQIQMQSQQMTLMTGVQPGLASSIGMPTMASQHGGLDVSGSVSTRRLDEEPAMASLGPPPPGHPGPGNIHTGALA